MQEVQMVILVDLEQAVDKMPIILEDQEMIQMYLLLKDNLVGQHPLEDMVVLVAVVELQLLVLLDQDLETLHLVELVELELQQIFQEDL